MINVEFRSFNNRFMVIVNGQVLTHTKLDVRAGWSETTGDTLMYDQGHFGFQSEGDAIKFQNIYITKLTSLDQALLAIPSTP